MPKPIYLAYTMTEGPPAIDLVAALKERLPDAHFLDPAEGYGPNAAKDDPVLVANIVQRNRSDIRKAQCLVADVTKASHGVGGEIEFAKQLGHFVMVYIADKLLEQISPWVRDSANVICRTHDDLAAAIKEWEFYG